MQSGMFPTAVIFSVPGEGELQVQLVGAQFCDIEGPCSILLQDFAITVDGHESLLDLILAAIGGKEVAISIQVLPDRINIKHKLSTHYSDLYQKIMLALWNRGFKPRFTYAACA